MIRLLPDERLQVMLADDVLKAVDDWRCDGRRPSRAASIRELLRRGLSTEGCDPIGRSTKSRDFGGIEGPLADAGAKQGDANGSGRSGLAGGSG